MRLSGRLKKLEGRAESLRPGPQCPDEGGWLALYGEWGAAGEFDHEPDFPKALAEAREAVALARGSADPNWLPSEEAGAGPRGGPGEAVRRRLWRLARFPGAVAAVDWLHEMRGRGEEGVPPVTEAEFAGLAAWLEANAGRLDALADRNSPELLDVGRIGSAIHPVRVRPWMVRYDLRRGPRADGSGRCAETVRRLRAMFPAE